MAKRKGSQFASQAALDAVVRYGPELSGLKELIRQAYADRSTARQQATGTRRAVVGAIDDARPGVAKAYDNAGLRQAAIAHTLVSNDLAALGGVANSIKAGAATEAAGAADRLASAKALDLSGLSQQRVGAVQGEGYAKQAANTAFVHAVAQVLQRKQDLNAEKGAFIASETGKLRQAHQDQQTKIKIATAGNQQSERNSLRSAGIDPDTGKAIPGGKLDPKAKKPGKPRVQDSFNSQVQSALTLLGTDVDPNKQHGRRVSGQSLINGEPAVKGKDKNDVTQTLVDAIKPHDPLAVRIANDMYYDGHLSPETVRLIHANQYRVSAIPGAKTWTKQQRAAQRARRNPKPTGNWLHDVFNSLGQSSPGQ